MSTDIDVSDPRVKEVGWKIRYLLDGVGIYWYSYYRDFIEPKANFVDHRQVFYALVSLDFLLGRWPSPSRIIYTIPVDLIILMEESVPIADKYHMRRIQKTRPNQTDAIPYEEASRCYPAEEMKEEVWDKLRIE